MRNFLISLAAVLLGNAVYFGIMPYLPPAAQHRAYQFELGGESGSGRRDHSLGRFSQPNRAEKSRV
jgi:hypothetical protein